MHKHEKHFKAMCNFEGVPFLFQAVFQKLLVKFCRHFHHEWNKKINT